MTPWHLIVFSSRFGCSVRVKIQEKVVGGVLIGQKRHKKKKPFVYGEQTISLFAMLQRIWTQLLSFWSWTLAWVWQLPQLARAPHQAVVAGGAAGLQSELKDYEEAQPNTDLLFTASMRRPPVRDPSQHAAAVQVWHALPDLRSSGRRRTLPPVCGEQRPSSAAGTAEWTTLLRLTLDSQPAHAVVAFGVTLEEGRAMERQVHGTLESLSREQAQTLRASCGLGPSAGEAWGMRCRHVSEDFGRAEPSQLLSGLSELVGLLFVPSLAAPRLVHIRFWQQPSQEQHHRSSRPQTEDMAGPPTASAVAMTVDANAFDAKDDIGALIGSGGAQASAPSSAAADKPRTDDSNESGGGAASSAIDGKQPARQTDPGHARSQGGRIGGDGGSGDGHADNGGEKRWLAASSAAGLTLLPAAQCPLIVMADRRAGR